MPVDPAVVEIEDNPDQEGLSFTACPACVGGAELWANVEITSGVYQVTAQAHYNCAIAEGNPHRHCAEACFRVVTDGSRFTAAT
jgi:hypothetical protein